MDTVSTTFGALSDPIRLRILALIAQEAELCVCELVQALEMPQPKISRHCRALADANLVKCRREAQWVLYSLADDSPDWVIKATAAAIDGAGRQPQHQADRQRLKSVERPPVRSALEEKEPC